MLVLCFRDFANGFLVAELLSRYFPDDIQMHSFENVTSIERKKSNWHLLKKFFKVVTAMLSLVSSAVTLSASGSGNATNLTLVLQNDTLSLRPAAL